MTEEITKSDAQIELEKFGKDNATPTISKIVNWVGNTKSQKADDILALGVILLEMALLSTALSFRHRIQPL
jgi:hypothetical protein